MTKSNPLFVDSTKMTGDSIGTQIELSGIALYEDESVLVMITNHLGEVRQVSMTLNEDLCYQTRVWLSHQKSFTYQFVVAKGEQRVLESVPKRARAQYAILDVWEPVLAARGARVESESEPAVASGRLGIPEHAK